MEKKEVATSIHAKLLEFQKLNISITKDVNNPHFKSKYADLSEVINKVRPALSSCGITLIQTPGAEGLTTTLHDNASGTEITGFLPYIGASDPQKLGSNLTYLRRYSLVTMLGLEDDDDDGNKATAKPAPAPAKPTMTVAQATDSLRKATTVDDLQKRYKALPANLQKSEAVIDTAKEIKALITADELTITE